MDEPCRRRLRSRAGLVLFVAAAPLPGCSRTDFDEVAKSNAHKTTRPSHTAHESGGASGGRAPVGSAGAPASGGTAPKASGGAALPKASGGAPSSGGSSSGPSSGGAAPLSSGGAGGKGATDAQPDARPVGLPDGGPTILTFAVVGDYGRGGPFTSDAFPGTASVSRLIHDRGPDFIITTGDNNYADGLGGTIDDHIGRFYSDFIGNYTGGYAKGSSTNRFWPSLGNHDISAGIDSYLGYFTLPGNERYYDVEVGPVHLFALNSDPSEADGVTSDSKQALWLKGRLAASKSCFDVVYFHHPPYNSGTFHGSATYMRWPFQAWGADVVCSGHEHIYERLSVDGIPYFISGTGGSPRYSIGSPLPESQARDASDFGALFVSVHDSGKSPAGGAQSLTFDYVTVSGKHLDSFALKKQHCPPSP